MSAWINFDVTFTDDSGATQKTELSMVVVSLEFDIPQMSQEELDTAGSVIEIPITSCTVGGYYEDYIDVGQFEGKDIKIPVTEANAYLAQETSGMDVTWTVIDPVVTIKKRTSIGGTVVDDDVVFCDKTSSEPIKVEYAAAYGSKDGCSIGAKSFKWTVTQKSSTGETLTDVPSVSVSGQYPNGFKWYAQAINWAVAEGITSGTSATTFNPDGNVTRQEMTTFLYRYAKTKGNISGSAALDKFSDAGEVADFAKEAMMWAVGNEIITGVGEGRLDPHGASGRNQVVSILYRYAN